MIHILSPSNRLSFLRRYHSGNCNISISGERRLTDRFGRATTAAIAVTAPRKVEPTTLGPMRAPKNKDAVMPSRRPAKTRRYIIATAAALYEYHLDEREAASAELLYHSRRASAGG